jgi:transposase
LLAIKINEITGCTLHASTVRRWLSSAGLVWRRAVPTLHIRDPHKEEKMAVIAEALAQCSAEHPVFYEDEVDIHLNPKIGADWQLRGQQKQVVTPGQNEKYYLAGALHSSTGKVSYIGGSKQKIGPIYQLVETPYPSAEVDKLSRYIRQKCLWKCRYRRLHVQSFQVSQPCKIRAG